MTKAGPQCRVFGCSRYGAYEVVLPPLAEPDRGLYEWNDALSLGVCATHADMLGKREDIGPSWSWVVVDVAKAAGWRLVVEFVSSPAANPLVLVPPECTCILTPTIEDERLPRSEWPRVPGPDGCRMHGYPPVGERP